MVELCPFDSRQLLGGGIREQDDLMNFKVVVKDKREMKMYKYIRLGINTLCIREIKDTEWIKEE